eukprot:g9868.t1
MTHDSGPTPISIGAVLSTQTITTPEERPSGPRSFPHLAHIFPAAGRLSATRQSPSSATASTRHSSKSSHRRSRSMPHGMFILRAEEDRSRSPSLSLNSHSSLNYSGSSRQEGSVGRAIASLKERVKRFQFGSSVAGMALELALPWSLSFPLNVSRSLTSRSCSLAERSERNSEPHVLDKWLEGEEAFTSGKVLKQMSESETDGEPVEYFPRASSHLCHNSQVDESQDESFHSMMQEESFLDQDQSPEPMTLEPLMILERELSTGSQTSSNNNNSLLMTLERLMILQREQSMGREGEKISDQQQQQQQQQQPHQEDEQDLSAAHFSSKGAHGENFPGSPENSGLRWRTAPLGATSNRGPAVSNGRTENPSECPDLDRTDQACPDLDRTDQACPDLDQALDGWM